MRTLAAPVLALAIVGACALPALPARATSVQVLTLEEMARRASVIVEATVVDVRVEREGPRAVTYTTLAVDEGIKGAGRGELLVVYQPGAADPSLDGGRVSWLAGQRAYREGERVVFFGITHRRAGLDVVVHLALGYGTFDVVDAHGGPRIVELVLDVVDARTHGTPRARAFASRAAFMRALE